jgi:hypothetical protein
MTEGCCIDPSRREPRWTRRAGVVTAAIVLLSVCGCGIIANNVDNAYYDRGRDYGQALRDTGMRPRGVHDECVARADSVQAADHLNADQHLDFISGCVTGYSDKP